jgi:hypothetical protein
VKAAYADPPYIGQAKRHYAHDPNCAEVDHAALVRRLCDGYDAWALSASSPSLKEILSYCPDDVRVAAWVKPFAIFKPNVNPGYCWEPIVFRGARAKRSRTEKTVRDFISCNITLRKGLSGAKPREFCLWIFDLLGLSKSDTLDDLFPGTGIVTDTWLEFCGRKEQVELFA